MYIGQGTNIYKLAKEQTYINSGGNHAMSSLEEGGVYVYIDNMPVSM
jgi:hypothetical protein